MKAALPGCVLTIAQYLQEDTTSVTEARISHNAIQKGEFISSTPVRHIIDSIAKKHLKLILIEPGGECPAIVVHDADLEDAGEKCLLGGGELSFINLGILPRHVGHGVACRQRYLEYTILPRIQAI
jgi:acyl-CoA reductase-like NAD-dependent aldehyde dehydrogenase